MTVGPAGNIGTYVRTLGRNAKQASGVLKLMSTARKNAALTAMAASVRDSMRDILRANMLDCTQGQEGGVTAAFLDRLRLTEERIHHMAGGTRAIADLEDPVGKEFAAKTLANGLRMARRRVPLGVILMIYESRPNVTLDAAALCLKSGNAVILRGGRESLQSNTAIHRAIRRGLEHAGLPKTCIQLVEDTDRRVVNQLLALDDYLDVVVPRGGPGLIRAVAENSKVPVIKHYEGNCHVYIDQFADLDMAKRIAVNAKVQRPGVCNAMETLLVHRDVAAAVFEDLIPVLRGHGVEIRACEETRRLIPDAVPAAEDDWFQEYLDLILAVRTVDDIDMAITHIERYGSHHSDAIVTEHEENARKFVQGVDSAAVYVNASTRFTDGGAFGMGAEIGISTDRLHARGPVGLEELTTYKYVLRGTGQIRE